MNKNGWTSERRKKQSEMIQAWKPWKDSTGAKTETGKERSKMNAFKHGAFSKKVQVIKRLLKEI